ncbi:hypothetical protein ONS95_005681 [Cadophora gregata]|uniref:uncharacterized protein n=1 Tax=Cadophora gregata TaxID=51156 RepID=UPI0026DCDCD4|nr:uncharacterized protein ONS95_005681 [Cadophora gregata]KAK0103670.1 hypothetical protein ONS95_005681 [Cadophora gregata]KAK0107863.1 hypothetical protein ONS96_003653 [Cadophora gregata f. sp. sojae]
MTEKRIADLQCQLLEFQTEVKILGDHVVMLSKRAAPTGVEDGPLLKKGRTTATPKSKARAAPKAKRQPPAKKDTSLEITIHSRWVKQLYAQLKNAVRQNWHNSFALTSIFIIYSNTQV